MKFIRIALGVAAIAGLIPGAAFAGTCPANKVMADGQKAGATAHKDVNDKVIASIDLAKEAPMLKDHK